MSDVITDNEIEWVYTQCKIRYGVHIQVLVLGEEASELARACSRFSQGMNRGTIYDIIEELADVKNLVEQLKIYYPDINFDADIEYIRRHKLARLRKRLIAEGDPTPF